MASAGSFVDRVEATPRLPPASGDIRLAVGSYTVLDHPVSMTGYELLWIRVDPDPPWVLLLESDSRVDYGGNAEKYGIGLDRAILPGPDRDLPLGPARTVQDDICVLYAQVQTRS